MKAIFKKAIEAIKASGPPGLERRIARPVCETTRPVAAETITADHRRLASQASPFQGGLNGGIVWDRGLHVPGVAKAGTGMTKDIQGG